MSKCPVCYGEIEDNFCTSCALELSDDELMQLKALTYDSIIEHLFESFSDDRRREKARLKIALKNIKKWANENLISSIN